MNLKTSLGISSTVYFLYTAILRGMKAYVLFRTLSIASLFYLGRLIAGFFKKVLTLSFYLSFFSERTFKVSINFRLTY